MIDVILASYPVRVNNLTNMQVILSQSQTNIIDELYVKK